MIVQYECMYERERETEINTALKCVSICQLIRNSENFHEKSSIPRYFSFLQLFLSQFSREREIQRDILDEIYLYSYSIRTSIIYLQGHEHSICLILPLSICSCGVLMSSIYIYIHIIGIAQNDRNILECTLIAVS